MPWADGVTKELAEWMEDLSNVVGKSVEVAKSVIDEEAKAYHDNVKKSTPVDTEGLKNSLKINQISKGSWYGYEVEFEGNDPKNKEPYQKIANIRNYGSYGYAGSFFITKNIKKLKGMTNRINARIDAELEKTTEGG